MMTNACVPCDHKQSELHRSIFRSGRSDLELHSNMDCTLQPAVQLQCAAETVRIYKYFKSFNLIFLPLFSLCVQQAGSKVVLL